MKNFSLILLLTCLWAGSFSAAQAQWKHTPTPNDTLQSIRKNADGSVTFSIYAPKARTVSLSTDMASFMGEKPAVQEAPNGVWSITVKDVKPGAYRYGFVVDGVKMGDPKAANATDLEPIATIGSEDDFFALRDVPHGALARCYYHSKVLNTTRRLHVWTPAGCEKGKEKLPVFYLIHGGGDHDYAWPGVGCAGLILDNLLAEGKIKPMIVVMPDGGIPSRKPDMSDLMQNFTDDLMGSVIPYIESNYRVLADKDHRAIGGLSMGGIQTLEVAVQNFDKFSYVLVFSSGFNPNIDYEVQAQRFHLAENAEKINKSFKILCMTQGGKNDITWISGDKTVKLFDKYGIHYDYSEPYQTGHTWSTWRNNLKDWAPKLFKE